VALVFANDTKNFYYWIAYLGGGIILRCKYYSRWYCFGSFCAL